MIYQPDVLISLILSLSLLVGFGTHACKCLRILLKFCTGTESVSQTLRLALGGSNRPEVPPGELKIWFLPRVAMHKRGICCHAVSVSHVRGSCQNE